MGGGSKTEVIQPQSPPPVTATQSAKEYAEALPTILSTHLQYQPQFNQAEYDAFSQYAPLYTQAARSISESLFPQTSALPEMLAGRASEGMSGELTPLEESMFRSDFNSQIGENAGSPIGATSMARAMAGERYARSLNAQNLGLSVAGFQPLQQPFSQQSGFNVASGFQPAFDTRTSGQNAYMSAMRPIVTQQQQPNYLSPIMQGVGGMAGGLGSYMGMSAIARAGG